MIALKTVWKPLIVTASLLAFTGCSSNTKASVSSDVRNAGTDIANGVGNVADNAAETAARNIATQQGEEQFKNAKQELNGPLTCTAKVKSGVSKIDVNCTGTTKQGGVAVLSGVTDEVPGASATQLTGQFVAKVDGKEVFTTKRLGG